MAELPRRFGREEAVTMEAPDMTSRKKWKGRVRREWGGDRGMVADTVQRRGYFVRLGDLAPVMVICGR
jgi:hypothetical protein